MKKKYNIGDIFKISTGDGEDDYIECIVMDLTRGGWPNKLKAVVKEEWMLTKGFFIEGDDYVIFEFDIVTKN